MIDKSVATTRAQHPEVASDGGIQPARLTTDQRVLPAAARLVGFNGDIVDEWGRQSFPASDPPANW